MGTQKKAGKAGARSVANLIPSTSKERAQVTPADSEEAERSNLCGDHNEIERGLRFVAGDISTRLMVMPNQRLEYVATFYSSEATVATYFTQLLSKLLGHTDAVQLEPCEVNMLGHLFSRLADTVECGRAVADQANYILRNRNGGRP